MRGPRKGHDNRLRRGRAELRGGPLPEIWLVKSDIINLALCQMRGMRHSTGGMPGLEMSGPWADRKSVKQALDATGMKHGFCRVGALADFISVIESGCWAARTQAGGRDVRRVLVARADPAAADAVTREIRLSVELVAPNSLPKSELKAKRV